jgi:kynurenine formamidase
MMQMRWPNRSRPKASQRLESPRHGGRFKKAIREKRGVRAVGLDAIHEDATDVHAQQFSFHAMLLAQTIVHVMSLR